MQEDAQALAGQCMALTSQDLRRTMAPESLGFSDTSELVHEPLPWIGQERARQAAEFGMAMRAPDYNLWVLGEVGCERTTLLSQLMHALAPTCAVPPDLCYVHNFEEPACPRAVRLPAGQGRVLRQQMLRLTQRLQTEVPRRLQQDDFKAESARASAVGKAQEDRDYLALTAYADAHRFALMREQGHMVFTLKDGQGEPVTAGKALALSAEDRAAMDLAEASLRAQIDHYLAQLRVREHAMSESLSALRRATIKPLLDHELALVRAALSLSDADGARLEAYWVQVQSSVLDNVALLALSPSNEGRQPALEAVLALYRVNLVVEAVHHHTQSDAQCRA